MSCTRFPYILRFFEIKDRRSRRCNCCTCNLCHLAFICFFFFKFELLCGFDVHILRTQSDFLIFLISFTLITVYKFPTMCAIHLMISKVATKSLYIPSCFGGSHHHHHQGKFFYKGGVPTYKMKFP